VHFPTISNIVKGLPFWKYQCYVFAFLIAMASFLNGTSGTRIQRIFSNQNKIHIISTDEEWPECLGTKTDFVPTLEAWLKHCPDCCDIKICTSSFWLLAPPHIISSSVQLDGWIGPNWLNWRRSSRFNICWLVLLLEMLLLLLGGKLLENIRPCPAQCSSAHLMCRIIV